MGAKGSAGIGVTPTARFRASRHDYVAITCDAAGSSQEPRKEPQGVVGPQRIGAGALNLVEVVDSKPIASEIGEVGVVVRTLRSRIARRQIDNEDSAHGSGH